MVRGWDHGWTIAAGAAARTEKEREGRQRERPIATGVEHGHEQQLG